MSAPIPARPAPVRPTLLLMAAGALALGLILGGPSLLGFFRFNEAYYHSNIGRWDETERILAGFPAETRKRPKVAALRAEAMLMRGEAGLAIEALSAIASPSRGAEAERAIELSGMAWALLGDTTRAREFYTRGARPFARSMAALLEAPTPERVIEARAAIASRGEKRALDAAMVSWIAGRIWLDKGDAAQALAELEPLVQAHPAHPAFMFDYALLQARRGRIDLARAYMTSALIRAGRVYPQYRRPEILAGWLAGAQDELDRLILMGQTEAALRLMRGFAETWVAAGITPDLARPLRLALDQPGLSHAAAQEAMCIMLDPAAGIEPALREATVARWPWLALVRADGGGIPVAQLTAMIPGLEWRKLDEKGGVTMWGRDSIWEAALPAPTNNIERRIILLRLRAVPRAGVGAGFALEIGMKTESGYIQGKDEWRAFEAPVTPGAELPLRLKYTNDSMPGVDGPEGDRNLRLVEAVSIDFPRN